MINKIRDQGELNKNFKLKQQEDHFQENKNSSKLLELLNKSQSQLAKV